MRDVLNNVTYKTYIDVFVGCFCKFLLVFSSLEIRCQAWPKSGFGSKDGCQEEAEKGKKRQGFLLLMAEILHHLRCMKPYKQWDNHHPWWCRISAINSISTQPGDPRGDLDWPFQRTGFFGKLLEIHPCEKGVGIHFCVNVFLERHDIFMNSIRTT